MTCAHPQFVCNNSAKCQIACLKTVDKADYANLSSFTSHNLKSLKGCNFDKNDVFFFKKAGAHLQYACNNCASFRLIAQNLWKELIIQSIFEVTDGQAEGKTYRDKTKCPLTIVTRA